MTPWTAVALLYRGREWTTADKGRRQCSCMLQVNCESAQGKRDACKVSESEWWSPARLDNRRARKKLLGCSASEVTSQQLNNILRDNSSDSILLCFSVFYLIFLWESAWIKTCVFFNLLNLVKLQAIAGGKKCCFKTSLIIIIIINQEKTKEINA